MNLKLNEKYLYSTQHCQYIVCYLGPKLVGPAVWTYGTNIVSLNKTPAEEFSVIKYLYSIYEFYPQSIKLNDTEVKKYIFPVNELIDDAFENW